MSMLVTLYPAHKIIKLSKCDCKLLVSSVYYNHTFCNSSRHIEISSLNLHQNYYNAKRTCKKLSNHLTLN